MKKKEPYMIKGNAVLAIGKIGVITKLQENTIDGIDYVYNIEVRLNGAKHSGVYHPADIQPISTTS